MKKIFTVLTTLSLLLITSHVFSKSAKIIEKKQLSFNPFLCSELKTDHLRINQQNKCLIIQKLNNTYEIKSNDQDPKCLFIKKWVPELINIPDSLAHEPWKLTYLEQQSYDFKLGKDYPLPIVDNASSTKSSRDKIWKIKSSAESKILSQTVLQKHTSAVTNFS